MWDFVHIFGEGMGKLRGRKTISVLGAPSAIVLELDKTTGRKVHKQSTNQQSTD